VNTFAEYNQAATERAQTFENFVAAGSNEVLDTYKASLIEYLSNSIVVRESRDRYQKEQFDRMVLAQQYYLLKNRSQTLDEFCRHYSMLIEDCISKSNNWRSPKIQANYDDFGEQTIRPLNSTIFYFYFSGSKWRRMAAQFVMSASRYPNEKVRSAYMRFFA
jgi:hypothetical protein